MDNSLLEATYALNNVPSLKNLLSTVISWRLFDLFMKHKDKLAELESKNTFNDITTFLEDRNNSTQIKCGFSIKSNVSGLLADFDDIDDNIIQTDKDSKIGDIIFHHVYGTHAIDEIIPLSAKQHTKLHNEIKKIYFEEILKHKAINEIYDEFIKAHEKTSGGGYNAFGDRVKAYEVTLVRIAIGALSILDENTRADIYKKALNILQANNTIPRDIKALKASELNNYVKDKQNQSKKTSVAEDFREYEIMWN